MNIKKFSNYLIFWFILLTTLESCTHKTTILTSFAGNKEQRDAGMFLLDHVNSYYGLSLRYKNSHCHNLNTFINNYLGENEDIVDSLYAYAVVDTLWDRTNLRSDYLTKNIKLAYLHYYKNPLGMTVPDSVFYEYILPYRVGYEKLDNWREHFNDLYGSYLKTFDKELFNEKFIVDMVHDIQKISFHVYDKTGLAKYKISSNQSLREIREVAHPYDCNDYAIFKLYSFRSLGLPAAYEVVPLYGKFNYGHSETSLMHRDGKFHLTEGKTKMPYKYQIAKMYRRQFSRIESPYDKILKTGETTENIPEYFNTPHYIDITKERTIVSDITIDAKTLPIGDNENARIGYLCVYNNGEWKPVEWSKREMNDKWVFKNMGRKILYHFALYKRGVQNLLGTPIILDTVGNVNNIQSFNTAKKHKLFKVEKYDRNSKISNGSFSLLYWDISQKKWNLIDTYNVEGKEITLNLTENTLYKLQDVNLNNNPRPFTIKNNEQIWW